MQKRLVIVACGLVSACGSRTGLDETGVAVATRDASVRDAAVDARDAADAPPDATDATDAFDEPEASPCGAPWVIFSLTQATEGGAFQTTNLYARRSDGSGGHPLALPAPPAQTLNAAVSPDGTELLYTDQTLSQLWILRFADKSTRRLSTQGGVGLGAISPDGHDVAFGDGQNVYLVGVDGGTEQSLVVEMQPVVAGSPVFTKDSARVVYGTTGSVSSIRLDGTGTETLIEDSPRYAPDPAFSPGYAELAVFIECADATELRVYSAASLPAPCESGRLVRRFPRSFAASGLAWGPAGLLAYSSEKDVFLVPASGGAPVVLTADLTVPRHAAAIGPTWAPACTNLP